MPVRIFHSIPSAQRRRPSAAVWTRSRRFGEVDGGGGLRRVDCPQMRWFSSEVEQAASGEHSCTGRRSTLTGRHNRTRKCLLLLLSCLTERKAFTGISHLLAYILLTQRSKDREDLICRRESAIAVFLQRRGKRKGGHCFCPHTLSLSRFTSDAGPVTNLSHHRLGAAHLPRRVKPLSRSAAC
ncbi:hypothetical protein CCUS01_08371 [Colletotrichum cuscutae]|uniref:Uncharacterized protein n=1 Tax=Colletotrichum cuscutae TaxID=1209917 RepID=A0AAI9XWV5_9PEZI|nr:hypothetical protein CCUS01_08371 [Colletotrichum cuscutae]